MIKTHDVEQGSAEWHELRAGKYTGSNAHKLLRFGQIEYARTETGTFRGNFYTKRGHILEDEAVELYETINGRQVSRLGFITNSAYPTCGYSPDGIDGYIHAGGILLEVKCFNEAKHMAIAKGAIPPEILAQIHFGMLISDLRAARLVLYNPDIEDPKLCLQVIEVRYNRNIQNNFKRILKSKEVVRG